MSISPWSLRSILDNHQRFTKAGLKVYMRIQSTVETDQDAQFQTFGYLWSPTGAQATGFTDILIQPPPDVIAVSQHSISLSGTKLRFGAHKFIVSHTFVLARMALKGFTDPAQVFIDPEVMGFVHNNRIFSLEIWTPNYAGAGIVSWDISANAIEQVAPASPST